MPLWQVRGSNSASTDVPPNVTTGEKERAGIAPRTTVGLSVPLSHSYYSALSLNLTGGAPVLGVSASWVTVTRSLRDLPVTVHMSFIAAQIITSRNISGSRSNMGIHMHPTRIRYNRTERCRRPHLALVDTWMVKIELASEHPKP